MTRGTIRAGLFAALAVASCAREDNASWVAKAGDVVVERAEVENYGSVESTGGLKGLSPERKRSLVQRLVVRKSLAADAEREGLGKDPAVATAVMNWKFKNYPEMYWAEMIEKEVKVSDEELRREHLPQARHLLSAMIFRDDDAGRREAQRVHGLLVAGGEFAELARQFSLGLSAGKGGDMGWIEIPNNMVEAKEAAVVAATPVGGFTSPVLTQVGWTVFLVRNRVDAEQGFQEWKAQVLPDLMSKKIEEAKAQRKRELRERATVTYPAAEPGSPPDAPAAIVNGYAFPNDANAEAGAGHGDMQRVFKPRQQMDRSIDAFLLVQEGERLGYDSRPEVQLKLSQIRMEVLAQLMLRSRARPDALTQAEVQEDYQRYYQPEVYEIQLIVVEKRERAEDASRRAAAGEDFDKLGQEYNTGQLAQNKGLLPVAPTVTYPDAVRGVLPELADGGVSKVLDLTGGKWGVVKRRAKHTFTPPTLEQVEAKIRRRLELKKVADGTTSFMKEYSGKVKVKFNEKLLDQL